MFSAATWKRMLFPTLLTGAILLPTASAYAETVTVRSGDTLGKLAVRYHLTVEQLKIANHLTGDLLYAGSTLYIPPKSTVYTVQSGDSLWKLAARFNTTIARIKEINQLNRDTLIAGEKLLIPATTTGSTVYTVVSGDVLWKIADRFHVTIQAIVEANKLTTLELSIGQKLIIPSNPDMADAPHDSDKPWVEMTSYTVQKGDTAWSISLDHQIPMAEFLEVNHLANDASLSVGQVVKIPVHHVPVLATPGPKYGEYLDWFEGAQYVFPINAVATVTDFQTGRQFRVKRTTGAFHSDTEPLTAADTAIIKEIWGGNFSWSVRPVIVEVNGRRLAASMSSMPHSIEYIVDNDFPGHFDIHFLNSLRHKDNQIDPAHQAAIRIAAGVN
ncbi:LysM peptidoglycan-binding domain-containing protein [Brevibacillus sp. SYP-B805]|uniref:LysM peptidoglycan-binding domain-containing protein n=1 Tax=Brevibacillus sp. SYP-B805 TaxID=1578199 RepID=UPI0013EAFA25|nr:LysM peptidoglycan-binding domain-containing protein [Brevibacillus sp. SYP-B805]NGQ97296.1 LysM peptidoglycan-binding domain-containing protein [Brevibacillus sp. SYP-B805]